MTPRARTSLAGARESPAIPLAEALDAKRFGGKAAGLATAIAHGLPVPPGVALDADFVDEAAEGDAHAHGVCDAIIAAFGGARVAVRSSAIGEDGASASFAGQHVTRLGVMSAKRLLHAITEVRASAKSEGARVYREKLGLSADARIGVVVQRMVAPTSAGVMFTKNPVGGADERVIEAAWGLGESVVAGLVVPDRYRLARGGAVLAKALGDKDVLIALAENDEGTTERSVSLELRKTHCLDQQKLAALESLAAKCDDAYAEASDIEWAFEGDRLYLLQRRPVTR